VKAFVRIDRPLRQGRSDLLWVQLHHTIMGEQSALGSAP
jgi:hypothetical protein